DQSAFAQQQPLLSLEDFTPLPCGNPNCHTISYLVRRGQELLPLSKLVCLPEVQGFLRDRINYDLQDLARCGCESEPLGHLLKQLEVGPDDILRLFLKPFMDTCTY